MSIRKKPYYTPLRYPGGKGKLANYLKHIAVQNDLVGGHYVEVYAGGAAVALELLLEDYFESVSINDIDPAIHAFWWSVLNDPENLCKKIMDTPVNIEKWKEQRDIVKNPVDHGYLDLGFATFFLNRCNRSGILKGGVIGGLNQDGKWKLDARYNKDKLIKRIELIETKADKIHLHNEDALEFITKEISKQKKRSLLYLDPPYFNKGKGLYRNFYTYSDHLLISKLISKINDTKWLISYDNVDEIIQMYKRYRSIAYKLSYTAQNKIVGSELLIFSDNLIVPQTNNPTKLRAA